MAELTVLYTENALLEALPHKATIVAALIESMTNRLAATIASAEASAADATHEEARPENDKDTRGLETSYLARGQAMRGRELHMDVASLRALMLKDFDRTTPLAASALVLLDSGPTTGTRLVFIAPRGGGVSATVSSKDNTITEVAIITPGSPLGRALLGRRQNEGEVEYKAGGRTLCFEILAVS